MGVNIERDGLIFAENGLLIDYGPGAQESEILRRLTFKYLLSSAHKSSREFIGGCIQMAIVKQNLSSA